VAERSLRADPASFGGTSGATCWDAHLASSYGFDSPLFRRGVCEPLSSMRSAFHPLDRLGEGLLVAGLERVRVVGLVLESAQDLRRRAARSADRVTSVRRCAACIALAAHDEPCAVTSAGAARGMGRLV